ncbi:MAG: sodium:proton antiporter [Alistipes senegalensis]|nr:sodium:proton antiporter [Bacteroides cellulosilyticus]MCM1352719.1 sodium:proton antiporter [Alistipes senegalensis]
MMKPNRPQSAAHAPARRTPAAWVAAVPLVVLTVLLYGVIRCFGGDAINGGSQMALLSAASVCVMLSIGFYGGRWSVLEGAIIENIRSSASAILILLLIGAIAGTWMVSGVVPTMIYYGLKILHPSFFLVASCVICAGVSVMTGSSWTTIATIGVALMGIGEAMGFAPGWVAGAIISGAYFGDKVSLLSDTTVLASSTVGVPVFTHIRYMLYTTVPSFVIALGVFTAVGFGCSHNSAGCTGVYADALASTFRITPYLLLVPLATGLLIARKLPAIVTLFAATVFACIAMLLTQPELVAQVAGAEHLSLYSGFRGVLMSCFGSTAIPTGTPQLDELVATRGMAGMLNTVWLILCAMCFGGVMTGSGMLRSLTAVFLRFVHRTFSAVASTVGAGIFFNLCTADQYISIILTGRLFRDLYAGQHLEERLLSRSVEDSATVCSVLIPWNSCGMTQATVLGVSTFVYMPYCIFNIASPLVSLVVAAAGWKIVKGNDAR